MEIVRLSGEDVLCYRQLMELFASEFDDKENYADKPPAEEYVTKLLNNKNIIFLVAKQNEMVVGGLVAYVLHKFEQQRSEIYIYDLAVGLAFRRQGIATSLINKLKPIARDSGAWVIYVQADYIDKPAVKLYESLGKREDVLHFDIEV